ncbi:hypothetical protein TcasGA2_TC032232 [Tribolium castaneum]|uniref:Uncharacterized protein n=1 Tax=Tribolium castaneum TaxID=7070 RepID=A0A139WMZ0_TRICA|nr:hypothetical protein TcasGA2_TC032232 [Tribolium castaneum]
MHAVKVTRELNAVSVKLERQFQSLDKYYPILNNLAVQIRVFTVVCNVVEGFPHEDAVAISIASARERRLQ